MILGFMYLLILSVSFNTKYTKIMLHITAKIMLIEAYCERIDKIVVNAPAPAIRGNATGTYVASLGEFGADLNISISRIISAAITNKIKEPAIANDEISMLNKFRIASPTYKKHKNINIEAILAFPALMVLPQQRIRINIGIEPITSIIANKMTNALINSCKLNELSINDSIK